MTDTSTREKVRRYIAARFAISGLAPAEAQALSCSAGTCDRVAVVALQVRDMPGHAHDCGPHSALVREHCDVVGSAPIVDNTCPYPCTAEPIYTAQPNPLDPQ